MASETPVKRTVVREIPSNFRVAKILPYALPIAGVLGLLGVLFKLPAYAHHAGAGLCAVLVLGLGYVGWTHTDTLSLDDGLRKAVRATTLAVVFSSLAAAMFTLYPPAAQRTVRLSQSGDHVEVNLRGAATAVVLTASGDFKPDVGASVRAVYVLRATHDGRDEEVEGRFTRDAPDAPDLPGGASAPTDGASEIGSNRHVLRSVRGAGRYVLTLDHLPDSVRPPVVVSISTEPFTQWMLAILYFFLVLSSVMVDAALARRGGEPAFAASMMVPLVASFYLHGHFTRGSLTNSLVSAGVVGFLGGGLGGEVLARVGRAVGGR